MVRIDELGPDIVVSSQHPIASVCRHSDAGTVLVQFHPNRNLMQMYIVNATLDLHCLNEFVLRWGVMQS